MNHKGSYSRARIVTLQIRIKSTRAFVANKVVLNTDIYNIERIILVDFQMRPSLIHKQPFEKVRQLYNNCDNYEYIHANLVMLICHQQQDFHKNFPGIFLDYQYYWHADMLLKPTSNLTSQVALLCRHHGEKFEDGSLCSQQMRYDCMGIDICFDVNL